MCVSICTDAFKSQGWKEGVTNGKVYKVWVQHTNDKMVKFELEVVKDKDFLLDGELIAVRIDGSV